MTSIIRVTAALITLTIAGCQALTGTPLFPEPGWLNRSMKNGARKILRR